MMPSMSFEMREKQKIKKKSSKIRQAPGNEAIGTYRFLSYDGVNSNKYPPTPTPPLPPRHDHHVVIILCVYPSPFILETRNHNTRHPGTSVDLSPNAAAAIVWPVPAAAAVAIAVTPVDPKPAEISLGLYIAASGFLRLRGLLEQRSVHWVNFLFFFCFMVIIINRPCMGGLLNEKKKKKIQELLWAYRCVVSGVDRV